MDKKKNIFIAIWSAPREAIKSALLTMSFWKIVLISFLGALGASIIVNFDAASLAVISDEIGNVKDYEMPSIVYELFIAILSALATLLIASPIMALVYWLFGKLFKGTGTFMDLFKGSMLAYVPLSIIPIVIIIWLVISPETFYGVTESSSAIGSLFMALAMAIVVLTFIYTIVVTIVMVSEVHQFSKWRAFFTIVIPTALITVVLVVIILIIVVFAVSLFA